MSSGAGRQADDGGTSSVVRLPLPVVLLAPFGRLEARTTEHGVGEGAALVLELGPGFVESERPVAAGLRHPVQVQDAVKDLQSCSPWSRQNCSSPSSSVRLVRPVRRPGGPRDGLSAAALL